MDQRTGVNIVATTTNCQDQPSYHHWGLYALNILVDPYLQPTEQCKTEFLKNLGKNNLFNYHHCYTMKSMIWSVRVYPARSHLRTLEWSSTTTITATVSYELEELTWGGGMGEQEASNKIYFPDFQYYKNTLMNNIVDKWISPSLQRCFSSVSYQEEEA